MYKKHYLKHKLSAQKLIREKVSYYAAFYGVTIKRIAVRKQRTRWGSCSKLGNLNYNYLIIFLSPDLFDFVIVHEICHLLEFNHSKNFWGQVSRTIPDYKEKARLLRKTDMRSLVKTVTI